MSFSRPTGHDNNVESTRTHFLRPRPREPIRRSRLGQTGVRKSTSTRPRAYVHSYPYTVSRRATARRLKCRTSAGLVRTPGNRVRGDNGMSCCCAFKTDQRFTLRTTHTIRSVGGSVSHQYILCCRTTNSFSLYLSYCFNSCCCSF